MDVTPFKEMLRKRGDILSGGGRDPLTVTLDTNTRQGDLADQATGNNEVHIQLKLKQTDAKISPGDRRRRSSGFRRAPTASAATAASRSQRRG